MSLPSRGEFVYVLVGIFIGVLVTALVFSAGGNDLGQRLVSAVIMLAALVPLIGLVALMRDAKRDADTSSQRLRDIEAEGWWLKTANRAVTNKRIGLGWSGRHPRRR